jgi:hypothetical protein
VTHWPRPARHTPRALAVQALLTGALALTPAATAAPATAAAGAAVAPCVSSATSTWLVGAGDGKSLTINCC